jgi:2-polyprenyl-3-methyl-5-hydroxy-6-metoxy-1,4-benzoquinol methylase
MINRGQANSSEFNRSGLNWNDQVQAWSHPPVDDVGYISSEVMLSWSDTKLRETIEAMRRVRYEGWRNHDGLWRELMGLDDVRGKDVLDFGCGTGIEAAEFVRGHNRVSVADLSPVNLRLATRVMKLTAPAESIIPAYLVGCLPPYFETNSARFDVVHCSGVLHHIPWAHAIMKRFWEILRPGGQVRLMLYSDVGWTIATGSNPPAGRPSEHPDFMKFVRYFDAVGEYADWYSLAKINNTFGDMFSLDQFAYLTVDQRYCAAVLTRKGNVGM